MNRILITSLCSLLAFTSVSANPIDAAKAKEIASAYLVPGNAMRLVAKAPRRSTGARKLVASVQSTSPYYIVSRGYDKGFVIISGDDCLPQVLGYTDEGDFDEENMPDAMKEWLQYRADLIEYAQENGVNTPYDEAAAARKRAASAKVDVPYLLTTLWHQSSPYNDKCPKLANGNHAATGCVATATAQVVYYWRRDANQRLAYTTPTYNYGDAPCTSEFQLLRGTPIKYDLMLNQYGSESQEYRDAVATLVAACGMTSYLTYGASTAGQISDCQQVFGVQFGINNGNCVYKSNGYTEDSWADLLYNELINGRPVLYCGYNSNRGGHAVVCDGYDASTGYFHINFGWGGGYNGYFSLVDGVQGWGFNESGQGCVYGIYPQKPNLEVSLRMPAHVYKNVDNTINVNVDNNGTIPFSGLYLFASNTDTKPTSLASAKSKNLDVVVARDGSDVIPLTVKPTNNKPIYITITDKDLNVFAKKKVGVETSSAQLMVEDVTVLATSEDSIVGDIAYHKVYNENATINVNVANYGMSDWSGTAKVNIFESADGGNTWTLHQTSPKLNCKVSSIDFATFSLTATKLTSDKLYYATINHEWGLVAPFDTVDYVEDAVDTIAYFCSAGSSDMKYSLVDGTLKFTGHWDAYRYNSICNLSSNKSAINYDITECVGVGEVPDVNYPNKNALVYAPKGATGTNVIDPDGLCEEVELTAGYTFKPKSDFYASITKLNLNQEANRWYMICPPFECNVPDGVIAREVTTKHATTAMALYNKVINVTKLEAGKTYLLMASSDKKRYFAKVSSGCNLKVLANPSTDVIDAAFVGTFTATTTPQYAKMINNYGTEDTQKFALVDEGTAVEGLRGYFIDTKMNTSKSDFTVGSNIVIDPSYLKLGRTIQSMYDAFYGYSDVVSDLANQAIGDSITKAEVIYSSQSLGSNETNKYYKALETFVEEYKTMIGDAGNAEVDMTSLIENPSFEDATTATGWIVGDGNSSCPFGTGANIYRAVGLDGSRVFYTCGDDSTGVSIQQTVSGLKPGYYRLTAMVGTGAEHNVVVFAGDSVTTMGCNPFGQLYLTKAEVNNVLVNADSESSETGSLTIGIKSGAWYKADDFHLTYVGAIKEAEKEDIVDAITSVAASAENNGSGIFTLTGQRMASPTRGINIVNGRKYIVK